MLLQRIRGLAETAPPAELPDRELVERFAAGRDEAAFAALVRRHGAMVLGVCRRVLGHEQDAEDVFQAVFLVLSRKAGGLHRKEAVGPWLFGVAHRLALRARQTGRKRQAHAARTDERLTADPAAELSVREAQTLLDEELARLPERERGPLMLCYLQGLTRDEAAQRLGCPLGTLKSRLERARSLLQKRLVRRGLALNAVVATLLVSDASAHALSADLVTTTVKAALAYVSKSMTTGIVGMQACALADGFLKSMLLGKINIASVYLLIIAACVGLVLVSWPVAPNSAAQQSPPSIAHEERPPDLMPVLAEPKVPEEPRSPFRFLDLQPHANQKLKERLTPHEGNDLASLPAGEQVLAGVNFNIGEGLIQLTGRGTPHPDKAVGIKVGTKFTRFHAVHATQWDSQLKEPTVAFYTVHYEDGGQAKIPVVYGRDICDWWYRDCNGPRRATVAWKGTNAAHAPGGALRLELYMTTWQNPDPARTVVSIDFISTNSDVAPFCVAMTVEE